MEINGNIPVVKIDAYANSVKERTLPQASSSRQNIESVLNNEDTVEISQNARAAKRIIEQVESIPDVREKKIEDIRNQIEEGTYQIDGKKIAFKMMKASLIDEIV